MTKTNGKKDTSEPDHRRTSTGNPSTPRMTKETASFTEKLAEKDSKRKKKKETNKTWISSDVKKKKSEKKKPSKGDGDNKLTAKCLAKSKRK